MTRTAIYCRVSGPGQRNTTSLPEQERIDRAHAASLGWDVSEAHVYHEVEGGEDLYRPKMDRLWDAIMAQEVDGLIFDVVDRLSREPGDQGAVYHHCDKYGVRIAVASQDIDETEKGRALRDLAGIVARMEHGDIRRRTQRGRKARVATGKMLTGAFPLYGYLWGDADKGQRTYYIIDPETAWVVRRIFEAVARGVSIRQIARELEAEGVPTPFQVLAARGMLPSNRTASPIWGRGTMFRMLHHPAYWGEPSAYRHKYSTVKVRPVETGVTKKVKARHEREVDDPNRVALPNTCPPLVSKDLAERVAAQLAQNKRDNPGRLADPLATLWRGMVVCGHCGEKMFTAPGINNSRRYCCHSRIAVTHGGGVALPITCPGGWVSMLASALDPAGWADVREWLRDPKNVERLLAEWRRREQTGEQSAASRLQAITAQLTTLRDKLGRLSDAISETANVESRRALQEKLDAAATQVQVEEVKRVRLLQEERDAASYARDERDIREWVCEVASQAEDFTPIEQRAALRALGAEATIWRADHVHADGWPQRYRITLNFTGFSGQPVALPAHHAASQLNPDTHNL